MTMFCSDNSVREHHVNYTTAALLLIDLSAIYLNSVILFLK